MKHKHFISLCAGMLLSSASLSAQNAPTIEDQTFTIAEKDTKGIDWVAGKTVGNVSAQSPDGKPLVYRMVTTGIPFEFKAATNELIVKDGSVLDYETKHTWTFKVKVSDGDQSTTATITVKLTDVNESPDNLNPKAEYTINENTSTGQSIGTFTVFDTDKDDKLTYSLSGTLTGAADANMATINLSDIFVLDETSNNGGTRTVSINVNNASLLDYEKLYNKRKGNAKYQATITITDSKGLAISKKTNISIKDVNESVFAKGGTFYLNEHSPIGSPVSADKYKDNEGNPLDCESIARVEGSDSDTYNTSFSNLTYQIIASKQTGNDYTKFTVDSHTGALYPKEEFDYETDKHQFQFIVTVSDGTFTADAEVVVKLEDITEKTNTTVYDGDVTVEENATAGATVGDFVEILEKIKDEDEDSRNELDKIVGDIDFTIDQDASGDAKGIFEIITTNSKALIKVKDQTKLDFEALYSNDKTKDKTTYQVVVVASGLQSNGTTLNVPITLKITVTDINEKPEITNTQPLTVRESHTNADGDFGKVDATDPDNGYGTSHKWGFNKLIFKVEEVIAVNGSTDFPFELNPYTGAFTVADGKKLDYATQKQYQCVVKVADYPKLFDEDGKLIYPSLSTTETITIDVTDINNPSEFRVLSDQYEVEENVDNGTELEGMQIVVYDEDDADLDALVITIKDNDATAARDAAKLFEVVKVGKTDENTHLSTFVIKTKAGIDYESLYKASESDATFNITLTITDTKGHKTSQETTIQIIDVNEAPAFAETPYAFTCSENIVDVTALGKVEANDPDIYNTKFGTIYYSLEGEDAAPFYIDRNGEISVSASAILDYETKTNYEFYAVATDKKFIQKVPVTVTVTDVDEAPVFNNVPELAVDEKSPNGTTVGVVTADDDDCKNNNTCKQPTYSLAATDVSADDYKYFTIGYNTGSITVRRDDLLNYEKKNEYSVRVVATDGEDPMLSTFTDVKIKINDVNDKPAYKENEYVFEIHENVPISEPVGDVIAYDEDSWSKLTYALMDYEDGTKDAEAFKIVDGKISTAGSMNYEKKHQYQLVAKATDNGKAYGNSIGRTDFVDYSASTLVTINLIDDPDNPTIVDNGEDIYVDENTAESPNNTPNDLEIARFEIFDEDNHQTATLQAYLTDAGNTGAEAIFGISIANTNNRYETILSVKDNSSFDYETLPNVHKVNICVKDETGLVTELTKTIYIRDINERPYFDNEISTIHIPEGTDQYAIEKELFKDTDKLNTDGTTTNNEVIVIGGDNDVFDVTKAGVVFSKQGVELDYETKKEYTLTLRLQDADTKNFPDFFEEKTFTIIVDDVNEAPVIADAEFSIAENSNQDAVIGTVKATDPESKAVTYSLQGDEASLFAINSTTGEISAAAVFDYETKSKYTFTVVASDGEVTNQATITVNILPGPTPVSSVSDIPSVKVWSYNSKIFIESTPDTKYTIIDINGRLIKSSTTKSSREEISINQNGTFVVIINDQSFKVYLR